MNYFQTHDGPLSFFELAGVSYYFCSDSLVDN